MPAPWNKATQSALSHSQALSLFLSELPRITTLIMSQIFHDSPEFKCTVLVPHQVGKYSRKNPPDLARNGTSVSLPSWDSLADASMAQHQCSLPPQARRHVARAVSSGAQFPGWVGSWSPEHSLSSSAVPVPAPPPHSLLPPFPCWMPLPRMDPSSCVISSSGSHLLFVLLWRAQGGSKSTPHVAAS